MSSDSYGKICYRRVLVPEAILRAIAESGRSDRSVSISAVGHDSAVSNLRRSGDLTVSTATALCSELGLRLSVDAEDFVPVAIARALDLSEECSMQEALVEIARLAHDQRSEQRDLTALMRRLLDRLETLDR